MYVEELRLLNIRSFKNCCLKFSKGVNILLGQNNSGKSTIIKAIYELQNKSSLLLTDIRKTEKEGNIITTLNEISETDKQSFKPIGSGQINFLPRKILINALYRSDPNSSQTIFHHYTNSDTVEHITEKGLLKIEGNPNELYGSNTFYGITDNEAENNFIYPFLAKRKNNLSASRVDLKDLHIIHDDFRFVLAKIKKLSNPGHHRNEEFLNTCERILGFKIGIIPSENQQENLGIFVNDSELISINQMGEGVIHIIGLISMLLTENNKLYLIEELENDLHPEALKALLELVLKKAESNQFIISTHSNIVLRYLGTFHDCKIHETTIKIEKLSEDINIKIPTSSTREIKNTPEERIALLEKLGYEPWDFELYKAYLILEESSAESIIRDFLIPKFTPSLHDKIKTIAAGGADDIEPRFHDFLRLFVFIHSNSIYFKRAWVLADGDEKGKLIVKELMEKFSSWPPTHFINFTKHNFEEYYPERFRNKFEHIQSISDKKVKRNEKKNLALEVLEWIKSDEGNAIKEFKNSAQEIINRLLEINIEINEFN